MAAHKFNTIAFMAATLAVATVFMPASVWAADDIFTIIAAKMVSTVQDIRQIVYVIAGFGLIMFAVLAVFNKISFKHLAYIMIGLSLLAVMMPFINYFSGAQLEDKNLNYGNYILGGDAEIIGSELGNVKPCGDAAGCPGNMKIDTSGVTAGLEEDLKDAMGDGVPLVDNVTAWDASGCRTVTKDNQMSKECCQGKVKNGKCKKTTKQLLSSIVSAGKSAVNAGKNVADAVDRGKKAYKDTKEGIDRIKDAIKNGDGGFMGTLETLGDIAQIAGQTSDSVKSGVNQGLGNLDNAMDYTGEFGRKVSENYETNPTGDNKFSDKLDESKIHDVNDKIRDALDKTDGDVQDYSGNKGAGGISTVGQEAGNLGDRIGSWFGGKK